MSREAIKQELKEVLRAFGELLLEVIHKEVVRREELEGKPPSHSLASDFEIRQRYQNAYTRALGLVKSIAPERYAEFVSYYEPDPRRKSIDPATYCIRDFFTGTTVTFAGRRTFDPESIYFSKLDLQKALIGSLLETFDNRIADIALVLQASLFDRELDTSDELVKRGHLRAGGAVAGVVLEAHLATVASAKGVQTRKKNPTIADLNDPLKDAGAYDVPTWRLIQRLGTFVFTRRIVIRQRAKFRT